MRLIGITAAIAISTAILFIINVQPAYAQTAIADSPSTKKTDKATENEAAASTSHLDLNSNECLKTLSDQDIVIASIAFKDGVSGFSQLKELVDRKPWGAGTESTQEEIKNQIQTQSPFLIISLTKKQILTLDNHRDIILWVLVQSTTKTCE